MTSDLLSLSYCSKGLNKKKKKKKILCKIFRALVLPLLSVIIYDSVVMFQKSYIIIANI